MLNDNLMQQFQFPPEALEGLAAANLAPTSIGNGVTRFSGHDRGVAYRFFIHTEFNKAKSDAAHYEVFDEIEMIEWLTDKSSRPTERVKYLPEDLLKIDSLTGKLTGKYAESYERFKRGLTAPGTALEKWGVLTTSEVATLAANNIFSVEQFAALPRDRIQGKFPKQFVEAFDRAIQFCNAKQNRVEADKQGAEILALSQKNAKLEAEVEALKEAFTKKISETPEVPKKRGGRPRKIKETNESDTILPAG